MCPAWCGYFLEIWKNLEVLQKNSKSHDGLWTTDIKWWAMTKNITSHNSENMWNLFGILILISVCSIKQIQKFGQAAFLYKPSSYCGSLCFFVFCIFIHCMMKCQRCGGVGWRRPILWGVCTTHQCTHSFSPVSPVFSHSPKPCRLLANSALTPWESECIVV